MIFITKNCSKNVLLSEYNKISILNENKGDTKKVHMLNYNAENIIINENVLGSLFFNTTLSCVNDISKRIAASVLSQFLS